VSERGAWTSAEALHWGQDKLHAVTDRPRREAEILLSDHLGCTRAALLAHPERVLAAETVAGFTRDIRRRAAGEPLPYIRGRMEFFGLDFTVTPDVLIPRPETEQLVELGRDWLDEYPDSAVIDVGTGSGCIAVALAAARPDARLWACDRSLPALRVARLNAQRHSVASRITFWAGDLLRTIRGPVDLILSNPPYIAQATWVALPRSVRHEPRMALLSGPAGLHAIRRLLEQAARRLAAPGAAYVEIGERQGDAARASARAAFPSADIAILPDLAGKDRVLQIIRRSQPAQRI
jgi:release factor glutamine methyltransferase